MTTLSVFIYVKISHQKIWIKLFTLSKYFYNPFTLIWCKKIKYIIIHSIQRIKLLLKKKNTLVLLNWIESTRKMLHTYLKDINSLSQIRTFTVRIISFCHSASGFLTSGLARSDFDSQIKLPYYPLVLYLNILIIGNNFASTKMYNSGSVRSRQWPDSVKIQVFFFHFIQKKFRRGNISSINRVKILCTYSKL